MAAALGIVLSLHAAPAFAEDARAAASVLFREGEAAERAGKYREAAALYGKADTVLPNDLVLAAGMEMAEKADDATLAMRLAERATGRPNTRLQTIAARIQKNMAPRSSRIRVECSGACTATIDGAPVVLDVDLWVEPGEHELVFRRGPDGLQQRRVIVSAGEQLVLTTLDVNVAAPAPPTAPTAPTPAVVPPPSPPAPASTAPQVSRPPPPVLSEEARPRPLPPWVFAVGAGVTAALTGGTVASAFDVKGKHDDFVAGGCLAANLRSAGCNTQADAGTGAETRTNVLLAASLGALAVTAVAGLFFVDWTNAAAPKQARPMTPGRLASHFTGAGFLVALP